MKRVSDLTYEEYAKIYPTEQFHVDDVEEYKASLYNPDGSLNWNEYTIWLGYTKRYFEENNLPIPTN